VIPLFKHQRRLEQANLGQSGGSPIQPSAAGITFLSPSSNGVDFNWYSTYVQGLVSATSQTSSIPLQSQLQITAAYDFYWVATTYKADIAGNMATITGQEEPVESSAMLPRVTISITDMGSGRILTPNPVPIDQLAGPGGERPYRLILPRKMPATTLYQFTWQAYGSPGSSITYNYIYLTLHGFVVPAGSAYPFGG